MSSSSRLRKPVVAGAFGIAMALGSILAPPSAQAAVCDSNWWGTGGAAAWCEGGTATPVKVALKCKSETSPATVTVYGPRVFSRFEQPKSIVQFCPNGYYRIGHRPVQG